MRITIVSGFFLPVPPLSGGATEKSWFRLAQELAAAGHTVTYFSRRWPSLPNDETSNGLTHRRLPGFNHRRSLALNLLLDLWWSWRVYRQLPAADIVISHAVALPVWLGRTKPKAGKVVVMCGRMPKGQYRRYGSVARVLAPSSYVAERVAAENQALAPAVRVTGYPVNWSLLATPQATPTKLPPLPSPRPLVLGFIGRIHEEKGLRLLVQAAALLGARRDLPDWRLWLCGPVDVARGGAGPAFRQELESELARARQSDRVAFLDPQFDEAALAAIYQQLDVFCYPSHSENGETFGVAVAEAMAARAVPVVSDLACFKDFVRDGQTGIVFDHRPSDAAQRLADALAHLMTDSPRRARLAAAAQTEARRFDFPTFAADLAADFSALAANSTRP